VDISYSDKDRTQKRIIGYIVFDDWQEVIFKGETTMGRKVQGGAAMPVYDVTQDLSVNTKSVRLTLSSGSGTVEIGDDVVYVCVKPVSSSAIRICLAPVDVIGTATGNAVLGDLKRGVTVDPATWTSFRIDAGQNRKLYITGGASDVVDVAVF
jgi:hypothetical protein